jgi:iron(III) transport system ATP-binding protein
MSRPAPGLPHAAVLDRSSQSPAVEMRALSKRYDRVVALSEVSLTLEHGRFLVLLGPSGSGKSTLLRCLAGIERPSAGSIALGGKQVVGARTHAPPERRDLAMVFQDFALWPHMTVTENVRFALRRHRMGMHESRRCALSMLERVGLSSKCSRYPHELSGGEQQRVALARALVAEPALLLLDEPLSSLDADLRERLRIEIGTLVRESGATAVYITHDQNEAFALGDEVGVLDQGRLVQHDTPEAIYRRPASAFVARFTGLAGELRGRMLAPYLDGSPAAAEPCVSASHPVASESLDGFVRVLLDVRGDGRGRELLARATQPLVQGQGVAVLVRPAAVRILSANQARSHLLPGIVLDSAFRGRGYDHVVRLADGSLLTSIFMRASHPRGKTVAVEIDPDGCLAFPLDATAEDRASMAPSRPLPAVPDHRAGPARAGNRDHQPKETSMDIQYSGEQT